ncbi:hypothetical protein [Clostridium sp. ZS2-4]|nr:hypothetical protein [Clostridium sp. ZS2-4]MCY6355979.1 hypothetical protein [Clostridium sp. ZS2-4]
MIKNKKENNRDINKRKSKLSEITDDSELYDEDDYQSSQIVTNYYYKPR